MLAGAVLGFLLGIVLAALVSPVPATLFFLLLALAFSLLRFLQKKPLYAALAVLSIAASFAALRVSLMPSSVPEAFLERTGSETVIEGKIVADPDVRETTQRIVIEAEGARVLAVAPLFPELGYGERVEARGTLEVPEPFETGGGRAFAYDQFLAKDGIFLMLSDAQISVTASRSGIDHVFGFLTDMKRIGLDALSTALPEPHAALAGGLILGGKQGLGPALLDQFIVAGLVHIVVLSGYNVMIVAEFFLRMFGFVSRRASYIAGAASIIAFVLVAGAGAASVRAGIMAAIAVFARASGRAYDAFRALVFAGVLMLLINPLTLLYDPGFQLSFVATLGLIFGAPLVEAKLGFVRPKMLRELLASTLAAQISVLPLLLYQNGLFSLVALPANVLALPVVPLAMLFSALALLAGLVIPAFAPVIAAPAYLLLSYLIGLVELLARLPLASFSIPAFPFALVALLYLLLYFGIRVSATGQLRLARKASM
jgi:competence protein ComEC